jgi:hypothetical protein
VAQYGASGLLQYASAGATNAAKIRNGTANRMSIQPSPERHTLPENCSDVLANFAISIFDAVVFQGAVRLPYAAIITPIN